MSLTHKDLLLIIQCGKISNSIIDYNAWLKTINSDIVLVNCMTPEKKQLKFWLEQRAKNMNLVLSDDIYSLLCYRYEGNLMMLKQTLEQISLMYRHSKLTLLQIEKIVSNNTNYTPYNWVDAILSSEYKRAMRILYQLRSQNIDPIVLLRIIQHEVLQLINFKKQLSDTSILNASGFKKIRRRQQLLFKQILNQITQLQLYNAIVLMTKIELKLKNSINHTVWCDLATLTLLLCGKTLPKVVYDG